MAPRAATAADAPKRAMMRLGCQSAPTNDTHLKYLARYGVRDICGYPEIADGRLYATVDELSRMKDLAQKNGINIECVAPPFLASSHIDSEKHPAIMLAQSPERDRDIEQLQTFIKNCAQVGMPSIKYNMSILGVVRTGRSPGRGDCTYSTWKFAEAKPKTPLTRAGQVNADLFWERITYFLDRVIPVANEYQVRMACHPHDPGMPRDKGFRGVHTVLGSVDGLKRFIEIKASPYHGLNFCQGTVSEMLQEPAREILDVIRYFGTRHKIFNVHFRNIKGRFLSFQETFPDNGDVDMIAAMRVYKEVGYDGMIMPDHVPKITGDPGGHQAFAFAFGYIQALIQMVRQEG